ncbi:hypothetical protein BSKO_07519 [Bryopsis sp. KO-2023]|nr:hypothetical protein BSKO_07519 [Bryopsis sp. KO-2023]
MQRKQSRNETEDTQSSWGIEDVVPEPLEPATPLAFPTNESRNIEVESPQSWRVRQASEYENESDYGEDCSMSLGWLCFIMGFILIFPWALGMILPLCSANRNDKWASYWNAFATVAAAVTFTSVWLSYPE